MTQHTAYLALRNLGSTIVDSIVPGVLPDDPKPAEGKDGGFEWVENGKMG